MKNPCPSLMTMEPTGSRVICNPPPLDTDEDYLCEVFGELGPEVACALTGAGFVAEGRDQYGQDAATGFRSWRKGNVNLIVTENYEFAKKHRAATALCKRLNLLSKADRIAAFRAVLYAECPSSS